MGLPFVRGTGCCRMMASLRLACWLSADTHNNAKVLLRHDRANGAFVLRLSRHAALPKQRPTSDTRRP